MREWRRRRIKIFNIILWWTNTASKINLDATAKINNGPDTRYYVSQAFSLNAPTTACPTLMHVFNTELTAPVYNATTFNNYNAYLNTIIPNPGPYTTDNANHRLVAQSWTFYCGTRWS